MNGHPAQHNHQALIRFLIAAPDDEERCDVCFDALWRSQAVSFSNRLTLLAPRDGLEPPTQ